MKSIAAGKFKKVGLKTIDEVAATRSDVAITKRGLAGSILKEVGNPFATGERWEADRSGPVTNRQTSQRSRATRDV